MYPSKLFLVGLFLQCAAPVRGQDVTFSYDKSCYMVGDNLVMSSTYTGPSTVLTAEWFYSGSSHRLVIDVSNCSVFGIVPSGFPESSRMSFQCNTAANDFLLTLTGLLADELNNKEWGATFTLASSPTVNKQQINICGSTTD